MSTNGHWLTKWERQQAISGLLEYDLIKWDNDRQLPLKSGGKTDVYINLRNARNHPGALPFIGVQFSQALLRLGAQRYVEIPDSVSCFTGDITRITGIPFTTIRGESKEGRVAASKMIGTLDPGVSTAMIDDVITDGASKIAPYWLCRKHGVDLLPLTVLVDRQQGWQKMFNDNNVDLPVWSGMTLHHVRKYLIENGLMQRCSPDVESKNPIIVALDGKEWNDILPLIDVLRTSGCILKVNDLLWEEGFKNLLPDLQVYGRVMADLKGHDIKNTLENISKRIRRYQPWAITVHGSGGPEMIGATVKALEGTNTKVLVVTVLTSIDQKTCEEIYTRLPIDEVRALARIAKNAGAHGLVCSPEEVGEMRQKYPDMTIVTPGVRSPGADVGDQKRVNTPAATLNNGANNVVMGRQILNAPDPVEEVFRVMRDELQMV